MSPRCSPTFHVVTHPRADRGKDSTPPAREEVLEMSKMLEVDSRSVKEPSRNRDTRPSERASTQPPTCVGFHCGTLRGEIPPGRDVLPRVLARVGARVPRARPYINHLTAIGISPHPPQILKSEGFILSRNFIIRALQILHLAPQAYHLMSKETFPASRRRLITSSTSTGSAPSGIFPSSSNPRRLPPSVSTRNSG